MPDILLLGRQKVRQLLEVPQIFVLLRVFCRAVPFLRSHPPNFTFGLPPEQDWGFSRGLFAVR